MRWSVCLLGTRLFGSEDSVSPSDVSLADLLASLPVRIDRVDPEGVEDLGMCVLHTVGTITKPSLLVLRGLIHCSRTGGKVQVKPLRWTTSLLSVAIAPPGRQRSAWRLQTPHPTALASPPCTTIRPDSPRERSFLTTISC